MQIQIVFQLDTATGKKQIILNYLIFLFIVYKITPYNDCS